MTLLTVEEIEKLLTELDELRDLYLQLRDERDLLRNQGILLQGERDSLREAVRHHNHTITRLTADNEMLRQQIFELRGRLVERDAWVMPPSGESA